MSDPPRRPEYTSYRSRRRLIPSPGGNAIGDLRRRDSKSPSRSRRPWSAWRVARWLAALAAAWVALSFVVFLVSAQIQQAKVADAAEGALSGGGYPLGSANTVLVLGSDQRSRGTAEPGASTSGPSRSDSILLIRVGGGHNGRLSIARDTVVDIPGHGRQKINAAYALGGSGLAIRTVEQYLGIAVNHVIEVSFSEFPGLIDAMGGVSVRTGCVVSRINGGYKNGGITLRLRPGKHRLNGKQALALARTRKNDCRKRENDLTRAKRQQQIVSAMRSKLSTPVGLLGIPWGSFYRLPLVAWNAPKTLRSDMSGPTLMGVFGAISIGGTPKARVLGTASGQVPDAQKQAAVRRFLRD